MAEAVEMRTGQLGSHILAAHDQPESVASCSPIVTEAAEVQPQLQPSVLSLSFRSHSPLYSLLT